ncbi:MAG TPA: hypothetical protein VJB09_00030 [Candidatus Paceibacterota bacterium]
MVNVRFDLRDIKTTTFRSDESDEEAGDANPENQNPENVVVEETAEEPQKIPISNWFVG